MNVNGGTVPKTDVKVLNNCMKSILGAISKGFISACHDISEGGLGVCLSEMCIGGDLGADINIGDVGGDLRSDIKLFSESNTRWIVEVKKTYKKDFEKLLKTRKTPFVYLGEVKNNVLVVKDNKKKIIDLKVDILRDHWSKTIWDFMG